MSKVAAYLHIVFCTKHRENTIPLSLREDLYRFIWKIIKDNNSVLIRIGGIQNHVHILMDLNPTVALASLVQKIKAESSGWMSSDRRFTHFRGWAAGYYASSITPDTKFNVIEYIKNQEQHHLYKSFDEEIISLHSISGLNYDERDMK